MKHLKPPHVKTCRIFHIEPSAFTSHICSDVVVRNWKTSDVVYKFWFLGGTIKNIESWEVL